MGSASMTGVLFDPLATASMSQAAAQAATAGVCDLASTAILSSAGSGGECSGSTVGAISSGFGGVTITSLLCEADCGR